MPGWQRAPQFGMGYAMQYPPGMLQGMQAYPQAAFSQPTYQQPVYPQHAYPQPVKASNPFDLGNEPAPMQAHTPLSGPLGASAGTSAPPLLGSSSFGITPQQPQLLYQSSAPPNHYMMQHVPNNMPEQLPNSMLPRQQGGPGSVGIGFDQQAAPRYSQPSTPPSYGAIGGNPFG